jgi:hypothetical protein
VLGCASKREGPSPAEGQLFWHLIDEPASDVAVLTVTVQGVELRPCKSDWIRQDLTPMTFNLLELQGGKFLELLSQLPLQSGEYCEARLLLDEGGTVILTDGTVHPLTIPGADASGFKIKGTFTVAPSMATFITVDFDAKKSLHMAGDKYILKPVVQIVSVMQFPAPPAGSKASVFTPEGGGALSAPTFELSADPGAVSTPTLVWCIDNAGTLTCGPDGTWFQEPISVAVKTPISNVDFDDTRTVILLHDGEPVFTVVDETDEWVYGRVSHFSTLVPILSDAVDKLYYKYLGEPEPMTIGNAANLKSATVAKGEYKRYHFKKFPGLRQTFCATSTSGEVDVYSSWTPNPKIEKNGTTLSGDPRFVATSDGSYECISLDIEKDGILYVSVYGRTSATFQPRIFTTRQDGNPEWLVGKLRWPLPSCGKITFPKYGPFNSPWGNACAGDDPFYSGSVNAHKLHTAVDIACASKKENVVRASCSGPVKTAKLLGKEWGSYLVQTCQIDKNHTISVAYVHIQNVTKKSSLEAGDPIGEIYPMTMKGELDHLHYAICLGDCTAPSMVRLIDDFDLHVRDGAAEQLINPDCHSNGDLYDPLSLSPECFMNKYAETGKYCP